MKAWERLELLTAEEQCQVYSVVTQLAYAGKDRVLGLEEMRAYFSRLPETLSPLAMECYKEYLISILPSTGDRA